jgi:hypothetical protein
LLTYFIAWPKELSTYDIALVVYHRIVEQAIVSEMSPKSQQLLKKRGIGMLRGPQHERIILNHIKTPVRPEPRRRTPAEFSNGLLGIADPI